METQQLACCGLFELVDLGNQDYYEEEIPSTDPARLWDVDYRRLPRERGIRACARDIRSELSDIRPRGRVVLATTVAGMPREVEALKRTRFQVVKRFRNGNSGNRVTVWMRHVC